MYFFLHYLCLVNINLSLQGIAPTFIAFRLSKEPAEIKFNATSGEAPPSRFKFRRTASGTDIDSKAQQALVPTIHFGAVHGEDIGSFQANTDAEAQHIFPSEQDKGTANYPTDSV